MANVFIDKRALSTPQLIDQIIHQLTDLRTILVSQQEENRLLNVSEVAEILHVAVSTIWRWTKENPDFPQPISLPSGKSRSRWKKADICAYLQNL